MPNTIFLRNNKILSLPRTEILAATTLKMSNKLNHTDYYIYTTHLGTKMQGLHYSLNNEDYFTFPSLT